jgi:hypothetical protein
MARYTFPVDSASALAVDTAFLAIVPAAGVAFKLRRVTIGVIAGTSAPTSQQLKVGINRATARGTATTTTAGNKMDPKTAASGITGVDTVWSTPPTLASADCYSIPFNSQSAGDLPFEGVEEFQSDTGTANPIVLVNRSNALPTSHKYSVTVEWEE